MTDLRLRYQTLEFDDSDIHVCTLRDNQQFKDELGVAEQLGISSAAWPIFGVIWPSSLILAHFIWNYQTSNIRILEVGCGIGLPSLILNLKHSDITATDHHPEAEKFINRNTQLNESKNIPFERTDWADLDDNLGKFDLIIGSDLLYEDQQIKLLSEFVERHANAKSEVILVDPSRGRKSKMVTAMDKFGFINDYQKLPDFSAYLEKYKGHILRFRR